MCRQLSCGCSIAHIKNECVELALDTIKQHFLFLLSSHKDLVHQEKKSSKQPQNNYLREDSSHYRSEADARDEYYAKKENRSPGLELTNLNFSVQSNLSSPLKSADLNAALSSEQLLNSSALSLSQDEAITETEKVTSPARTRCNWRKSALERLGRKPQWQQSFVKTENKWLDKSNSPSPVILGKKKAKLSLNPRSYKMKQSRLQFEKNKNIDNDVVKETPNLYTSLKQAQQSRSMILKTKREHAAKTNSNDTNKSKFVLAPTFTDECDDHYFDFSDTKIATPKPKSHESLEKTPDLDTSSVVILTPATQDIVFLDDSTVGATQINTMDLMSDLLKFDDAASLTKLRRFEAKSIDQQKRIAGHQPTTATKPIASPVIKAEPVTQHQDAINESTKLWEADLQALKSDLKNDENMVVSESEEEEMVRPIIIKTEADVPPKKLSFRERYGFDCKDCEKFVRFFTDNLNAKQIEDQLRSCKHNKYLARPQTPEGFWNPLMVDFPMGDERNDVLTDNRFKDRKQ